MRAEAASMAAHACRHYTRLLALANLQKAITGRPPTESVDEAIARGGLLPCEEHTDCYYAPQWREGKNVEVPS